MLASNSKNKCIRPLEAAGDLGGIASITNNIGYRYASLGLYARAIRFYRRSLEIDPTPDYPFNNITHIEIEMHDLDHAHQHVAEARSITKSKTILAFVEELAGRIALLEGKPKGAIRHFKEAIKISHDAEPAREIGELALLGQAYLAQGNLTAALKATSQAVKLHRALGFPLVDDHPSQNIWWRYTLASRANGKKAEAREALGTAYNFLLEGIASLQDAGLRRNYLNKIAVNREIIQAWVRENARRKVPKEQRFPHLAAESNIREPFQRLAEISLELNTLHSVQEIQTFLVEEATELSGGERVMLILEGSNDFAKHPPGVSPSNKANAPVLTDGVRKVVTTLEVAHSILPRGEDAANVLKSVGKHLTQARLTRTAQLILPHPLSPSASGRGTRGEGKSRIVAPLIAQNQLLGYLYVDMDALYGTFDETDRDMLGMLANQGAVALDNAGLLEGLERKVEERTEELNQRVDELAILNSVGEAMAKTLDVKTVTKIVGDKVRDIFNADAVSINLLEPSSRLIHPIYEFDKGEGGYIDYMQPFALGKGLNSKVIQSRQPLLLGTVAEQLANGAYVTPEQLEQDFRCDHAIMGGGADYDQ